MLQISKISTRNGLFKVYKISKVFEKIKKLKNNNSFLQHVEDVQKKNVKVHFSFCHQKAHHQKQPPEIADNTHARAAAEVCFISALFTSILEHPSPGRVGRVALLSFLNLFLSICRPTVRDAARAPDPEHG